MAVRKIATLSLPTAEGRELVALVVGDEGRLYTSAGTEVTRELFVKLRESRGALILTSDPERIRRLLKMHLHEAGIIEQSARRPL